MGTANMGHAGCQPLSQGAGVGTAILSGHSSLPPSPEAAPEITQHYRRDFPSFALARGFHACLFAIPSLDELLHLSHEAQEAERGLLNGYLEVRDVAE